MTDQYAIHGRVVRSVNPVTLQPSISFELIFPEDWVLLERQLSKASCGFAQLQLDALGVDALDSLDAQDLEGPATIQGYESLNIAAVPSWAS